MRPTRCLRGTLLVLPFLFGAAAAAQDVSIETRDAVVWAREQVVRGLLDAPEGLLLLGGAAHPFTTAAGTFEETLVLGEGENVIVACTADESVCSDTLRLTLGYALRPDVYAYATVSGSTVQLHAEVLDNPEGEALTFAWSADPENPLPVTITGAADTLATATLGDDAPAGEYYFDLVVTGDETVRARTFVTKTEDGLHPFDIDTDEAAWIDAAVIYQVTPYIFEFDGRLSDVTERLPELATLGVNTIWLQPVFETAYGGQGYDITNYFTLRRDYGTEADLHALIDAAHARGMRVLLDFVPNHSSILHPYAQDAVAHGEASHYFDFYQRERDDARYAMHYNTRHEGAMTFTYYFWEDLPNLNYHHLEVRRWITEAARHWVEAFDIDGYRVDAVWGVRARNPDFLPEWRRALKRVKPELLLLGEDKATDPTAFEVFDVAYDWYPEESWVSHWSWQTEYNPNANPTIFNHWGSGQTAGLLRDALTNEGEGWHPDAEVLRFMENNDTYRFIVHHGATRTRMVAALLFSLPGIPLLYNGQEIGFSDDEHPYETDFVFNSFRTIQEQDDDGFFPYYQQLIRLREAFPALYGPTFAEVPADAVISGSTFAYHRWDDALDLFGVVNMASSPQDVTLTLPVDEMGVVEGETYFVTDLQTGAATEATGAELADHTVALPGYTTHLLAVSQERLEVPTGTDAPAAGALPEGFVLGRSYPNPFATQAHISLTLDRPGRARLVVYDVLGREVARLVDASLAAGRHTLVLDGTALPAGVYYYRATFEGHTATGRMTLVR